MTPPKYWIAHIEPSKTSRSLKGWKRNLAALADVMFADDSGAPPSARIDWTVRQVAEFCRRVGGKAVFIFRLALWAISWVGPLMFFSLPPLRRHTFERRAEIMHRFERSPFGLALFAVKAFLCMHYFEHPDVAEEVHFDGELR